MSHQRHFQPAHHIENELHYPISPFSIRASLARVLPRLFLLSPLPLLVLLSSAALSLTLSGAVPVPSLQPTSLVVLVTGAARGIGLELVQQYATAHPGNIVLAAVRQESAALSLSALAAQHSNVNVILVDVDSEEIRRSVAAVERVVDHVDVLVNNAAISGELEAGDALKVTAHQFAASFHTNVTGTLCTTQSHLPLLHRCASPKVITSAAGWAQPVRRSPR